MSGCPTPANSPPPVIDHLRPFSTDEQIIGSERRGAGSRANGALTEAARLVSQEPSYARRNAQHRVHQTVFLKPATKRSRRGSGGRVVVDEDGVIIVGGTRFKAVTHSLPRVAWRRPFSALFRQCAEGFRGHTRSACVSDAKDMGCHISVRAEKPLMKFRRR
jgi:hypothetical protein